MANSNTEHSKKLRQETSKKFNKFNYKRLEIKFNINNTQEIDLYKILKKLGNNRKKILYELLINNIKIN